MEALIESYLAFLSGKKTANTIHSYGRDLSLYVKFLTSESVEDFELVTRFDIQNFLQSEKALGKSAATTKRMLSSIKRFHLFLLNQHAVTKDVTQDIANPKITRATPLILSVEEVAKVLDSIPTEAPLDIRDKAMMEMMYATGIQASEIIDLKTWDVNLAMKFVKTTGVNGHVRVLPLNDSATDWVADYMKTARVVLRKDETETHLFLNHHGRKLTRQGLWKNMRKIYSAAGITKEITPQTLRNSFAAHLLAKGADIRIVQELMGHQSIATTQAFMSAEPTRVTEIYQQLFPR